MNALQNITYGLFILSAKDVGRDNACIINTAFLVSDNPNTLAVCLNKASFTHKMIEKTGLFTLSVISEKADISLFRQFGFVSGEGCDKFANFGDVARDKNGLCYITRGTNAYITCKVVNKAEVATHTVFFAEICDQGVLSKTPAMTYKYYHEKLKK